MELTMATGLTVDELEQKTSELGGKINALKQNIDQAVQAEEYALAA
jgi:hypothetical protein